MTNKLGFYLHNFEIGPHKGDLFRAIQEIRPPVMLVYAWDQVEQLRLVHAWLDSDDPEARGREFTEHILRDNFGMAGALSRKRPVADRRLDELQRGGARAGSAQYRQDPGEIERRLRACNAFQVGFLTQLIGQGVEAVAFNFGAGIFATAEHYGQFFSRTLVTYTYLSFHEYGWPALSTALDPTVTSRVGSYRTIVQGLSQHTGRRYEAILTEAGLALMYKYPNRMDQGWLCTPPELDAKMVSQDDY